MYKVPTHMLQLRNLVILLYPLTSISRSDINFSEKTENKAARVLARAAADLKSYRLTACDNIFFLPILAKIETFSDITQPCQNEPWKIQSWSMEIPLSRRLPRRKLKKKNDSALMTRKFQLQMLPARGRKWNPGRNGKRGSD